MKEQHSRIHIVNILAEMPSEFTSVDVVNKLSLSFYESQAVVSAHLRELERKGLVRLVRRASRNRCIWTVPQPESEEL